MPKFLDYLGFLTFSDKDYYNSLDIAKLFTFYLGLTERKERGCISPADRDELKGLRKALRGRSFEEKVLLYKNIGIEAHLREYLELYDDDIELKWSILDEKGKVPLIWSRIIFRDTVYGSSHQPNPGKT